MASAYHITRSHNEKGKSLVMIASNPTVGPTSYDFNLRKNMRSSIREKLGLSMELRMSSDWGSFQVLDDDDNDTIIYGRQIDRKTYATENDEPEVKQAFGSQSDEPITLYDAEPIFAPAGSQLQLDEETVLGLLSACRIELGTLFGYTAENRGVGITGGVEFIEIDGGTVVLSLSGRYWHQRTTVLARVANYIQQRIPEVIDVMVNDPWQLTDDANQ
jgi:hypothetical protein